MIDIQVTQSLVNAWEVWNCRVPDDFPVDGTPGEQLDWVLENGDRIEWENLEDSGCDAFSLESVEVVGEELSATILDFGVTD